MNTSIIQSILKTNQTISILPLRLIAGIIFTAHPHKNMEIISYIRTGAISHTDSKGNTVSQILIHQAYVLAPQGSIEISDGKQTVVINKGDGAEVTITKEFEITALENSEVIVIDVTV